MARSGPKVVVRYLVDSQGFGGFQGQVQVINDGTQPIAAWQIVIALPDDTVTGVQNQADLSAAASCCCSRPTQLRSCRPAAAR